jgi:hypothetical protein
MGSWVGRMTRFDPPNIFFFYAGVHFAVTILILIITTSYGPLKLLALKVSILIQS